MADDGWSGRSHADIVAKLSALKSENAYNLGNTWTEIYTDLSDAADKHDLARRKLATEGFWTGKGPAAALQALSARTTEFDDSETGTPALAGKMSNALTQDGEVLTSAHHVAQAHPELGSGAPTDRKKEELEAIRNEAQRLYTTPLEAKRPDITDNAGQPMSGPMPQGPGGNNGGASASTGSGGAGEKLQSPSGTDGLANKDTKPQLAGGDGQQAGAGQGGGQGAGSGGGTPGGGQGSGSGGGAGSGFGSGAKDSASGLPVGGTTAAGFSPSATGTGGGTASGTGGPGGLSALRGGGLPGGVAGGTGPSGVNPAAIGPAGVRGVGPMGMMGGAGAHGAHGKGGDDDEKPIPNYLINVDNGNELFGEPVKASPGVIGDWTENEQAEKKAREAEKRRYKSMGWDVRFSDEAE